MPHRQAIKCMYSFQLCQEVLLAPWHLLCQEVSAGAHAFGGADHAHGNADIYNATQGQATGCYVDQNQITYGEDVSVTNRFFPYPNDWVLSSDEIACSIGRNICSKSAKLLFE